MHNYIVAFTDTTESLEYSLRRKKGYLLTAFFDQAADPVQNACLGLLAVDRSRRIKLIVKRNVGGSGGDAQRRLAVVKDRLDRLRSGRMGNT